MDLKFSMAKFGYGSLVTGDFHKVLEYQAMMIEDLKSNGT